MATITTSGSEVLVKNIASVSTTPIRMTLDRAVNSFTIKARTTATIILKYFATDEQTEYYTIPVNSSLTINRTGREPAQDIGWIATTTGTDVVEIIGVY
jgi:hypothetical protein